VTQRILLLDFAVSPVPESENDPEIHSINDSLGKTVLFVDQVDVDPRSDGVSPPKLEAVMHTETEKKKVIRPFLSRGAFRRILMGILVSLQGSAS
jgi:hypothetical protein